LKQKGIGWIAFESESEVKDGAFTGELQSIHSLPSAEVLGKSGFSNSDCRRSHILPDARQMTLMGHI
jgi:hypothetical protein